MPTLDKPHLVQILFNGGTLVAADALGWTKLDMPLDGWDNHSYIQRVRTFDLEAVLAEWLTLAVDYSSAVGAATLYVRLTSHDDNERAISLSNTISIPLATGVGGVTNIDTVLAAIDVTGAKSLYLWFMTDAGTVNVVSAALSYSPK